MRHLTVKENVDIAITRAPEKHTLTLMEASELEVYIEEHQLQRKFIIWGNHSIRFINYVCFIQCPSFSMDILPKLKIADDNDTARHTLLMMLDEVQDRKSVV